MHISTDLRLPATEFFNAAQTKDLIVLHHTVGGSAKSTFDYWRTDPQHIGTAYIVERDGTIFEVFPDRKSTRLNSSHVSISYAVFCLKKKKTKKKNHYTSKINTFNKI